MFNQLKFILTSPSKKKKFILTWKNMEKSVSPLIIGENIILVLTFWGHSQFDSYILLAVNLILFIFNLQSIWFLPLIH